MNLIFVNRFFFPDHSATSQLLSDLAFHLAGLGDQVHVVTSRQRYEDPGACLLAEERVSGVSIHRVWTSRFGRNLPVGRVLDYVTFYLSAGWLLLRLAGTGDTVVAKTDPPLISVVAAVAARLRGARIVNWMQDVFPEAATALGVKGVGGWVGYLLQRCRDASLKRAVMNVALSEAMAAYLVERGAKRDRVCVIPNWADEEAIIPVPTERNRLRQQWGLAGKFVAGYSGNMGRAHEFETILDAIARLESEANIVFLFIGGGNQRVYLENEAVRRGLSHIQFKPYQPRELLAESLGAADVHLISLRSAAERFVVPSKFYGVAAAGRPVIYIGDRNGEIARTIRSSHCGATVQPQESAELASLLLTLRNDEGLRREWGRNARHMSEEKFSKKKLLSLWRETLLSCRV